MLPSLSLDFITSDCRCGGGVEGIGFTRLGDFGEKGAGRTDLRGQAARFVTDDKGDSL